MFIFSYSYNSPRNKQANGIAHHIMDNSNKDALSRARVLVMGKRGGILRWPEQVVIGCQKLGVPVQFLALNHQNSKDRLIKRGKGLISKRWQEHHLEQQLERTMEKFQPNLVIFPDIINLSQPVHKCLLNLKSNFTGVSWIGDFFPDSIQAYNDIVDRFYFTDSYLQQQALQQGLHLPSYLPLAVDTDYFCQYAQPWQQRDSAILFVGAFSTNRYQLIGEIEQPITIYGKNWNKPLPPQHQIHPQNISLNQVAGLYGSHKFVLNIMNKSNISNGLNMRCFEATAAGAVLVSDQAQDMTSCLEPDKDLLCYQQVTDINNIVMLPDDQLRQIAQNGKNTTLNHHSYVHRVAKIITDCIGTTHGSN